MNLSLERNELLNICSTARNAVKIYPLSSKKNQVLLANHCFYRIPPPPPHHPPTHTKTHEKKSDCLLCLKQCDRPTKHFIWKYQIIG